MCSSRNPDDQIIKAIETLAQHHTFFFSSQISDTLLVHGRRNARAASRPLTSREREIVQLVAEGNSNKKIAKLLDISVKTVETHRAAAMHKLNIHSTADLVRYAVRNKLVEPRALSIRHGLCEIGQIGGRALRMELRARFGPPRCPAGAQSRRRRCRPVRR